MRCKRVKLVSLSPPVRPFPPAMPPKRSRTLRASAALPCPAPVPAQARGRRLTTPSSNAGPDGTRPAQKRLRHLSQSHDVLAPRRSRPIELPAKRTPESYVTSSAGHPSSLLALAAGNVEAEAAEEAADSSTSSENSAQPLPAAAAMSERPLWQTTAQRARRVAEAGDLGGLTPLEANHLAKKSAKAYKREVEGWTSWSRDHDRPLDSPAGRDLSLIPRGSNTGFSGFTG